MPQFKLKDGRELEIADNGITSENAIVFHHGTPGHVSAWGTWLEQAAERGIRAISAHQLGRICFRCIYRQTLFREETEISKISAF
jgi:hypothetical protein